MRYKIFSLFAVLMLSCGFGSGFIGGLNALFSFSGDSDSSFISIFSSTACAMPATNSKLSQGKTLKIATDISGIYRVNYSDLASAGLVTAPVPTNKIALYGNRAGILSRINDTTLYDDLQSLPIEMYDGGDGTFNQGDYFIFYGQSPLLWKYTRDTLLRQFEHQFNYYSDYTCYFVSVSADDAPKRVENAPAVTATPQITVSSFTDYVLHENEIKNICSSGLNWVGESFPENGSTASFSFNLPDIDLSKDVVYSVQTAVVDYNTSAQNASFSLTVGQQTFSVNSPSAVADCAGLLSTIVKTAATSSSVKLQLTYNKTMAGNGFLDFIEIQYTRNLTFPRSGELIFRTPQAINKITRYNISGATTNLKVWDITNPLSVKAYTTNQNSFIADEADCLREYIAFDGTSYRTPMFLGVTDTQNLHNAANPDFIIVSHPDFIEQAEKIAQIHRERDKIDVLTTNVQQVYNEFSSGSKDPSAIRLLAKMFNDRYMQDSITYKKPRYLLLFGNASVDPKGKSGTTTDFIPTFETYRSTDRLGVSFSSPMEDAFAYLDNDEGNTDINGGFQEIGIMDIAVGRIPVKNKAEAIDATEKIDIYTSPYYLPNSINPFRPGNFGSWRNLVTFISDDNDGFVESYESTQFGFGPSIYTKFPNINFEKIYSDAYRKVSTSVASTYPEAHKAILDRINGGGLFVGYIGHSGWSGCADEGLMSVNDISELWETTYSFPIMFFSSCSASPFDKTDQNSIGEQAVLFPHGGAIAVIAAPRENFKNYIEKIQADFVASITTQNEKEDKTIGDAFLYAKRAAKNLSGFRFVLLGDPALRLPLPKYNIVTTHINGVPVTEEFDTLSAYSTITVNGYVSRATGTNSIANNDTFTEFNGILQVSVFDKLITEQTLGNPYSKGGAPNPVL
ncbi:MAG: type IX secretion system sortase PorU, partial [Bacteroidales bacterium]|nr:type IX secretion system sortase PorU [Bacteroidales bacterium]